MCWLCQVMSCYVLDGNKCQPRIEAHCQGGVKSRENENSKVGGIAQRGHAEIERKWLRNKGLEITQLEEQKEEGNDQEGEGRI